MRVATYTRISTDEEHQPFSLEAQAQRLGSYIQSQDSWQLVHRFTDQMSGSTLERPGLQDALALARAKRYDMLLVYRVDRLSRSVRGLAQVLEELDHAGVNFRSATEPFDTGTAAGRMMVQMLGVFAEFERATLIDRVIAGMERKAARGEWLGGRAPYGYRLNRDTALLEPNESEAPVARLIFDLYTKKRLGARGVANYLSNHGYRSRPGQLWSHVSVLNVLRNRAYVARSPSATCSTTRHMPRSSKPQSSPRHNAFSASEAKTHRRGEATQPTSSSAALSCAPLVEGDTSARPLTAATPGTATTRASRGTATAGKAAATTFCGRISSTRRSSSRCLPPMRTQRSSARPSSGGVRVPPSKNPTPHRRSAASRQRSRAPNPLWSATTAPSRTAGYPSRDSAVESTRLSVE